MASLAGRSAARVRTIVIDAKAVRYAKHGNPSSVLKFDAFKLDTASVKPGMVIVRMLAAPITPVDLAQVRGAAAWPLPGGAGALPRVGGNEGVGVVEAAGAGSALAAGDVVIASQAGAGTWATHAVSPADAWTKLSAAAAAGPLETLAAAVSPVVSAKGMLEGFLKLKKGDVVVQNNGACMVAQAVTQLAAAEGVRVVSLVRPAVGGELTWSQLVPHLTSIGAALVVSEEEAGRHEFAKTLKDLPPGTLGLNASGGAAATLVARALGRGATLVTYGSTARRPAVALPLDVFTAGDVRARGFNAAAVLAGLSKADRDAAAAGAAELVAAGAVKLLVAREPFKDFDAALTRAQTKGDRQVTLLM